MNWSKKCVLSFKSDFILLYSHWNKWEYFNAKMKSTSPFDYLVGNLFSYFYFSLFTEKDQRNKTKLYLNRRNGGIERF